MKNKLFLCSHGDFAKEIICSAEMIIGPMEDAVAICLQPGMSGDDYLEEMKKNIELYKEDRILVLADLFGGTPCNTAARLLKEYSIDIITGLNLGMLLEVYSSLQTKDTTQLKEIALKALQMSCVDVNKKMGL